MPVAPGLHVRQCVVEVAVQRAVVDEAAQRAEELIAEIRDGRDAR
jgi:hypothetical protein